MHATIRPKHVTVDYEREQFYERFAVLELISSFLIPNEEYRQNVLQNYKALPSLDPRFKAYLAAYLSYGKNELKEINILLLEKATAEAYVKAVARHAKSSKRTHRNMPLFTIPEDRSVSSCENLRDTSASEKTCAPVESEVATESPRDASNIDAPLQIDPISIGLVPMSLKSFIQQWEQQAARSQAVAGVQVDVEAHGPSALVHQPDGGEEAPADLGTQAAVTGDDVTAAGNKCCVIA